MFTSWQNLVGNSSNTLTYQFLDFLLIKMSDQGDFAAK